MPFAFPWQLQKSLAPPRPVRPTLVHRPSSASAKRWTIAVSDIPDDGDFLKEIDRLKEIRDAKYQAPGRAQPKEGSGDSAATGETSRPETSDEGDIVHGGVRLVPSDSRDESVLYVGVSSPEEDAVVWMKARKAMLHVREFLRTESSYRHHLIQVWELEVSLCNPLF